MENKAANHITFLRDWASDIRANSGASVDAEQLEAAAYMLEHFQEENLRYASESQKPRHPHWRVCVETSGEQIVAIESEMLAGREISEADEHAIRTAAHHLLVFIGDPAPTEKEI